MSIKTTAGERHAHTLLSHEVPASTLCIGDEIAVPGDRAYGRVTRIEPMGMVSPIAIEVARSDWSDDVPSQPVLKVEFIDRDGDPYYIARFPHELVNLDSGARDCTDPDCQDE